MNEYDYRLDVLNLLKLEINLVEPLCPLKLQQDITDFFNKYKEGVQTYLDYKENTIFISFLNSNTVFKLSNSEGQLAIENATNIRDFEDIYDILELFKNLLFNNAVKDYVLININKYSYPYRKKLIISKDKCIKDIYLEMTSFIEKNTIPRESEHFVNI